MKGKIELVKGQVYVYREGRTLQAVDDMNLYTGDILETSRSGSIMVQMMDMGLLKLKHSTQVHFPAQDENQIQVSRMNLEFGEIWTRVRPLQVGESFQIKTPHTTAMLNGTIAVLGHDTRRKKSSFSVIEGRAEVHRSQDHFFLDTSDKLVLDIRANSRERKSRIDVFVLNQEWKDLITIREKVVRRLKREQMMTDVNGGADFEKPVVHIVSPRAEAPQKKALVELRATVYDPSLERIIIRINGKVIKDLQTGLSEIVQNIELIPGLNEIEVEAIDRFGNTGRDLREIRLSEIPPVITLFQPIDQDELTSRFVDLQGVVDDPDVREVQVYLNGRRIARDRATPTFLIPIILDIGHNRIRVTATNGIGLSGETEIEVYTDTNANLIINFDEILNQ